MKNTEIADCDVYWEMTWGEKFPDKPPTEMMFEGEKGLARLLANDVVHLNTNYWKKEWPEEAQNTFYVGVICNDIFAWACADSEELPYSEIQNLYDLWYEDQVWGPAKWCAIKRNQKPQAPVIRDMKRDGAWDAVMEALGENTLYAEVQVLFASLRAQRLINNKSTTVD